MLTIRKIGSYLKNLSFSTISHRNREQNKNSTRLWSSEKHLPVEFSFSVEDSKTIDVMHIMDEVAAQEHKIIPTICSFLDQCVLYNDYNEVEL